MFKHYLKVNFAFDDPFMFFYLDNINILFYLNFVLITDKNITFKMV